MHHDVGYRVKTARRKFFRTRDEIAGGVVDEIGEGALGPDRVDHLVDRLRVADVDAVAHHAPAVHIHQFSCGLVADDFASAADMNLGAQLKEAGRHGLAEAGAASGDENAPPGEKLIVEHCFHPRGLSVNWSID